MEQEITMINKILLQNLVKKRLKQTFSKLTPKERKIISMRFGLEDGIPHNLESICKELGVTLARIRRIEAKVLKEIKKFRAQQKARQIEEKQKEPYVLKIYKGYLKRKRKYWKTLKFPNFEELEECIWKLFRKNYKITEVHEEIIHTYQDSKTPPLVEIPTEWSITEMWICNKKEGKCYLFEPKTDRENELYDILGYLYHNYPKEFGLSKYQKRIKSLSRKEIEKFVVEAKKQTKLISLEEVKKLLRKKLQEP